MIQVKKNSTPGEHLLSTQVACDVRRCRFARVVLTTSIHCPCPARYTTTNISGDKLIRYDVKRGDCGEDGDNVMVLLGKRVWLWLRPPSQLKVDRTQP
jgi:hypothetical protein